MSVQIMPDLDSTHLVSSSFYIFCLVWGDTDRYVLALFSLKNNKNSMRIFQIHIKIYTKLLVHCCQVQDIFKSQCLTFPWFWLWCLLTLLLSIIRIWTQCIFKGLWCPLGDNLMVLIWLLMHVIVYKKVKINLCYLYGLRCKSYRIYAVNDGFMLVYNFSL
jgi:hypothetical protein